MPAIDFETLTAPVSPDDPCGPDLDLAGDSEYMNFVVGAEGRLPSSYFDGKDDSGAVGRPFQFAKLELDAVFEAAGPLLEKTRDLRLMLLLAKYSLLGRELKDFITIVKAVAALLRERWDEVHPRAEDGEFQARMVAVESIEAQPTVIMPLQFVPLIEHRRFGTVSYRSHMVASGAIPPREGEDAIDGSAVDKVIREADLAALIARRGEFTELQAALNDISETWSDKIGSGPSIQLEKVSEIVGKIVTFLDGAVTSRDPDAGLVPPKASDAELGDQDADAGVSAGPVGRITNSAEAAAALAAVADYFSRHEPSSPTLLLVRQANQLLGKSFLEVMRTLVPMHVEQAAINIGRTESFTLPIERLSSLAEGDGAGAVPITDGANGQDEATHRFDVLSRNQALALLDQVAAHFRAAEPSSPVPFLIERARDLAQRDFLSVLKALLPADTLKPNNG